MIGTYLGCRAVFYVVTLSRGCERRPGAVLEHVLSALRQADAKLLNCPEKDRS